MPRIMPARPSGDDVERRGGLVGVMKSGRPMAKRDGER